MLGQRWVVLTGLIEDAKQRQTFEELFQETEPRLPQNDQPDYLFYAVKALRSDRGRSIEVDADFDAR